MIPIFCSVSSDILWEVRKETFLCDAVVSFVCYSCNGVHLYFFAPTSIHLHFDILCYLIDVLLQWKRVMLTSVATGGYMAKTQKTSIRMVIPQVEI